MYQLLNSAALKLLPNWLYERLVSDWNKDGFKKYFKNTGWLFAARGATFVTSFLTMAMVARYLGPENLGKISYAQSFVSILSVFASLGIDQILYRDLTAKPEKEHGLIGTAVLAKFIFGFFAFVLSIVLSLSIDNETLLTQLVAITAFTFLINPLGTIAILFQAKVQARYTSHATIFIAFFIPILKILVIVFDKGVLFFAGLLVIEALISTVWSLYIYINKFKQNPLEWKFEWSIFKQLMNDSWPFLFAGFFSYIYARIDQVMLQQYLGSTSVGLYDVAVRISNIWSFIPALIISSVFPALVSAKKISRLSYLQRYRALTILVMAITLAVTLFVFIFARPIILILFGEKFIESIILLQIYIWSGAVGILGILVQQYLITENKGRIHLYLTLTGALINISLNLFMIPRYGAVGAAISTLFSYSVIPLGLLFLRQFRDDLHSLHKK
ncbi:MAG: flippase [Candidatus Paceibacterota bacterium]